MYRLRRRAATTAAAASLLAGSAMLAFPAGASAETKKVECGGEVTAKPGDTVVATRDGLLGLLTFDLGKVTESTDVLTGTAGDLVSGTLGGLSDAVCKVTVNVVEPVPVVGETAADAVKQGTKELNETAKDTVDTLNKLVPSSESEQPAPEQNSPSGGGDAGDGSDPNGSSGDENSGDRSFGIASPSSPAIGGGVPLHPAFLPLDFSSGFAPMRDYGGIPFATPGVFAPAPGIRYGSGIPGYQPEFDVLGLNDSKSGQGPEETVSKVGQAKALPGASDTAGNPASLPVLLAVIALAGSTAGLVRTWVLRRA